MKKIITIIAICLIISTGLQAQNTATAQKIGHINSLELLSLMPGMKKAQDSVKTLAQTFEKQLSEMQKEYKSKVDAFNASTKTGTLSEAIKEVKIKEITDLEGRIMQLNKSGEKKVQETEQSLTQPVLEIADKAIKTVAKEKGYTYVLDSSSGALLHAEDKDNLLNAVKTKLGIK